MLVVLNDSSMFRFVFIVKSIDPTVV